MAKKVKTKKSRKLKQGSAVERFLNYGYLLFNRHRLEYKGDLFLWFALISYKEHKYKDVFEYIENMKEYDRSINNFKRIKEVETIEHLTEQEILQYGEEKYQEFWKQLQKEVDLELKKY